MILGKKALLVIDMQKGSFTRDTPRFNAKEVINSINLLARLFRKYGYPVFFIQHNGKKENSFLPNTWQWQLLSELHKENDDIHIEKYANDCFYKSSLSEKLKELNIDQLFLTGCATDFCVEATIQSALSKDYDIIIVKDGHTTADRPHVNAQKIIEHYNWVWANMIPTEGTIKVIDSKEIALTLEQHIDNQIKN